MAALNVNAPSHPRGLYTLFFTEMWERFSYYGMRALLVLFLTDRVRGGFGLSDVDATAIYGIYTASVYLAALPGGWAADRWLGAHRSVWIGGIIIACGHFILALDRRETFFLGLTFIVIGTGLLKPNISALVATLYPEGGARRDAGFTIFYMGINLGAALGPIVCSALGEKIQWRFGFAAAGVGMVFGLIQFALSRRALPPPAENPKHVHSGAVVIIVVLLAISILGIGRFAPVSAPALAKSMGYIIAVAGVLYFGTLFAFGKLKGAEKRGLGLIGIFFISSALFWAGFEQVGSSFTLFADRYTDRAIGPFQLPAGAFQALGPIFIITLAPIMAAVWLRLGRRKMNPSTPAKFGVALIFLAAGFGVMSLASREISGDAHASAWWLISTYFLHTVGELCLSPVGLSSVTKLAPKRLVGQMMGVWFLATSFGNLLAGVMAGQFNSNAPELWSRQFLSIAILPLFAGVILIALAKLIRAKIADV